MWPRRTNDRVTRLVVRNSRDEGDLRLFVVEGFTTGIWLAYDEETNRLGGSGELFINRPVVYREREYRLEYRCGEGEWSQLVALDTRSRQVGENAELARILSEADDGCSVRWGIELQPGETPSRDGQPASRSTFEIRTE